MIVKHVTHGITNMLIGLIRAARHTLPASVNRQTAFLWRIGRVGRLASKTPNQGLEGSFCCWIAGERLLQKECCFHMHRY